MAITGFGEIAEQLRRSTVLIHSGGRGSGSGVIWSSDGPDRDERPCSAWFERSRPAVGRTEFNGSLTRA